jgi:hypothetical protein
MCKIVMNNQEKNFVLHWEKSSYMQHHRYVYLNQNSHRMFEVHYY